MKPFTASRSRCSTGKIRRGDDRRSVGFAMTDRKLNFSSGPAALPEPVLRRAQAALWDLDGSGIGILEHSHRGSVFRAVLDRTTAAIRELAGLGDHHAVLFVTAGATHHFT